MTAQELKKSIDAVKAKGREVSKSSQTARDFLVAAGICTPKGNLRKAYR